MIFEECPVSTSVVLILGLRDIEQHQQGSCLFSISSACLAAVSGWALGRNGVSPLCLYSYPWSVIHRDICAPGTSFSLD